MLLFKCTYNWYFWLKFLSYWLYKQTAAVLHPILFQLPISNNESCCTERFFEINLMKKFEREASIRYLKKEYLFEKQMNTWKRPIVYVLFLVIEAIQLSLRLKILNNKHLTKYVFTSITVLYKLYLFYWH
jgi:hypothetical protein